MHKLPGVDILHSLALEKGTYAIYGSGPLAVRGIRATHDLDVVVARDVFDILLEKHPDALGITMFGNRNLQIGEVEVCDTCPGLNNNEILQAIDEADIIDDLPFLGLPWIVQTKKFMNREKDRKDISLIQTYLDAGGK